MARVFVKTLSSRMERERCLALMKDYRLKLQASVAHSRASPLGLASVAGCLIERQVAVKISDAICKSLESIERAIENERPAKNSLTGDFSLDEMALAESIIAEQEHNPFEG